MVDRTVVADLRWRMACWLVLAAATVTGARSLTLVLLLVAFAPLVLVPLGVAALLRQKVIEPAAFPRWVLDVGAACAVAACLLPVGRVAGVAALGWLAATVVPVTVAAWRWLVSVLRRLEELWTIVALAWLPAAAGWYVASRAGIAPFGFGEPITVLTAAHFHVAGFATSTLAVITMRSLTGAWRLVATCVVVAVMAAPVLIAIGFMTTAKLNMIGAHILAAAVLVLAACSWAATTTERRGGPRSTIRLAALMPLAPLGMAVVYSLGPVFGTPMPTVELMVRTHGVINALGFAGLGLLGWSMATIDVKEVGDVDAATAIAS